MSVIRIGELFENSGSLRQREESGWRFRFQAESNNIHDRAYHILRSPLIPKPGDRDPYDPTAFVVNVDANRIDESKFWEVEVETSSNFQEPDENPLNSPADISLDSEQFINYTTRDIHGNPILTSAGSLIPVPYEDSFWIFNVAKNLRTIPTFVLNMNNRINNGTVFLEGLTCAKKTLMVKGMRASETQRVRVSRSIVTFKRFTFQLHYNPNEWKTSVPNVDYVQLVQRKRPRLKRRPTATDLETGDIYETRTVTSGFGAGFAKEILYEIRREREKILLGDPKEEITDPWPLDRQGRALPANYDPNDINYKEPEVIRQASFSLLPLR